MFIKVDDENWINLNYCRQIEIIESYGKSIIILRSGVVVPNSFVQSTFLIRGFETNEIARNCVDRIFKAYRANEIEYDLKARETDNVVLSVDAMSEKEFEEKWMNDPTSE